MKNDIFMRETINASRIEAAIINDRFSMDRQIV